MVTYHRMHGMKDRKARRKALLLLALLMGSGMASAQVLIEGNVYGGCEVGNVSKNTTIEINNGTMKGSVYGGGMGSLDNETQGAVLGNTLVNMKGGTVERSIYGGGELGSVGTFTAFDQVVYPGVVDTPSDTVLIPKTCQQGTGFSQVLIYGGQVGLRGSTMPDADSNPDDDDRGWIFTGCQGEADSITYHRAIALGVVDSTYLEIKGGVITASVYGGCENGLVLRSTNVKIEGGQIGTGYRGNNVWDDPYTEDQWNDAKTAVTNGTVGTYENPFHECDAWPFGETVNNVIQYNVYDIFYGSTWVNEAGETVTYKPENTAEHGSNGQTFFGKVFGGGSGFYPIAPGVWRRTAGQVRKDTYVEITGGHILTSVYGGNETTDVLGTAHVKMTGGTLGVPRDSASIVDHPVTCYLFGAGMGDPRVLFNTWTNVENVDVEVRGDAFIFGSVFGGGEEGHVLADVDLTIKGNAHIGTLGYSYVDGNVFGGGRGFSGEALTAGTVGGNVEVNIEGGTILGSVYGGGRLASVGTYFTDPLSDNYGHFQDGDDHGYTTVNISGGRIGNNYEDILHPADHTKGGNVFGGSMGRVTLLDGITENHLWPRLAQVKQTKVNITTDNSANPPVILGNVYGGCEYGSVRDSAIVVFNAENATIYKIFGGGYGSSEIFQTLTNDSLAQPAALAGRVMGNTLVKLKNGTVEMSVYGGGEFASVGRVKRVGNNETLINGIANVIVSGGTIGNNQMYLPDPEPTPDPDPTPDPAPVGPRSDYVLHVDHSGHVFGGGQGIANDVDEDYKDYCNVNHTRVTIKGGKVYGSVFGGGAESHVMGNDSVFIRSGANIGTIGTTSWDGNIFGGGKGNGYMVASREDGDGDEGGEGDEDEEVFVASKTVGRVGGNTYIDMDGGTILGSIFGGGRLGITGIRGIDANGDFDLYLDANGKYDSINHGKATIKVFGKASVVDNDTVYSTVIGTSNYVDLLKSNESVGDIFGSGKGDVDYYDDIYAGRVANTKVTVTGSPRIHGSIFGGGEMASLGYWKNTDDFYENSGFSEVTVGKLNTADTLILGTYKEFTYSSGENPGNWTIYETVNNVVTISHTATGNIYGGCQGDVDTDAPHWISMGRANGTKVNVHGGRILSSVFGGGEQGFVLGNTEVNVTGGTIGQELKSDILNATTHEVTGQGHYHLGSIFGGGYGTTITDLHSNDSLGDNKANAVKWAGRVYGNTEVNFSGGQVYANVYGGGDLASVGRYRASIGGQHNDSLVDHVPVAGTGHCKVNISGTAYLGHYEEGSYGFVFGGGKGVGNDADRDFNLYCNVNTTEVVANLAYSNDNDASNDGRVGGSIFGGSPYGHVLDSTYVELKRGIIGTTGYSAYDGHVFGGGWGDKSNFDAVNRRFASGRVGGTTHVKMTGGTALGSVYGGGLIAMTGVGVDGSFDTYHNAAHEYDSIHHGRSMVEITGGCVGDSINHSTFLLSDEKCGNVYGGGRGDIDEYIEDDFARMANAIVSISGSPVICGSVYGGGQMANVGYWNNYDSWYSEGTGDIRVTISGTPKIGTQLEFDHDNYAIVTPQLQKTVYDTINGVRRLSHTRTGNVFGGGQGDMRIRNGQAEGFEQGHCERTEVNISGNPVIRSSVFGGSEQGAIWGDTKVNISGGTIGTQGIKSDSLKFENNQWVVLDNHATYSFGSVYGGSYGKDSYKHLHSNSQAIADTVIGYAGRVYGNTKVTITGGHVYENVYGGGNLASVGEFKKVLNQSGDLIGLTPKANTGHCEVNVSGSAVVGPLDYTGLNAYVYGGGKGVGDDPSNLYKTYCNVNSVAVTVNLNSNGRVYGSLFGGGSDAHTLGDVSVTLNGGLIGTEGFTSYDGNIFGGGRNYLRHNYTAGRVGGNTTVEMTDGQIMGNIFGGGRIALTGVDVNGALQSGNTVGNTKVMVKGGTVGNNAPTGNTADPNEIVVETFADYSMGSVYGGGMGHIDGIIGHPAASALLVAVVKNTEVEISDTLNHNTHVYGIVYGGGEVSNVGSYSFVTDVENNEVHIHNIDTVAGTGLAKVTISGGIIGGDRSQMRYTLADGTYWPLYNDDLGYVYGGGKGISDNPNDFSKVYEGAYGDESMATSLINLMGTTIHTEVTITEAEGSQTWVKGSVFGGSEAGHVRGNTLVTISGGQIGAGYSQSDGDLHYDEDQFVDPVNTAINNDNALQGTVHWDFGRVVGNDTIYAPFDLVDLSNGIIPSDGKSWFGNVFGGGSGWFPYVENPGTAQAQCSWNPLCGKVWGNTHVVVEGGHILNNVYGGNESTDVGGKTLVEIKGGTVGVPRTKQQIIELPTLGYVFGGGCGDPRTIFDNINNVDSTKVIVTGGTIYGSVYGGAEDGHVLGDARVSVSGNSTIIGCKGLSTADGNIFGGGRNYLGENNKAGRVGGNITVNLTGGHVQGSVYGGGRMALSGVNANGVFPTSDWPVADHGNVTINVSGVATTTNGVTTYSTVIGNADNNGWDLLKLNDESVGDIFGSGKGDTKNYQNILAGRVTNATINVTGSPRIYGSVFGGGEMASLGWWEGNDGAIYSGTGKAIVNIGREGQSDNPVIGTYLELDATYAQDPTEWTIYNNGELIHTCTGNVFGGSQGDVNFENWATAPNLWPYMGRSREAIVNIYGGTIMSEVYGGSEQGSLTEDTHVTVKGGTIGSPVATSLNPMGFFGSVVGAGYGSDDDDESPLEIDASGTRADEVAGRVYGDVTVDMLGGTVVGNVYGGAAFAYVGEKQTRTDKGNVTVNIGEESQMDHPDQGPTILGNVFGANYDSGTPYGNVEVNVYSTRHNHPDDPDSQVVDNCYPHTAPTTPSELDQLPHDYANFALRAVYGGSDRAHYTPLPGKSATVHVYDCNENTIYDVYGGCNAAAIGPSTTNTPINSYVIIDGGYFNRVFGGGNGEGGISADIHGSANTTINGGIMHDLFGGSNNLGQINEINLVINEESDCAVLVGNGYGGNNSADIIADVTTTLNCGEGAYANFYGGSCLGDIYGNLTVNVMGGTYTNFFAGSRGRAANPNATPPIPGISADIREITAEFAQEHNLDGSLVGHGGNITLNLYGGNIENAFGGSDVWSQIDGKITVNVIDTVKECGLELTNLYGAGRHTTYRPLLKNGQVISSPEVNVIHGDVLGNVYGGAYGDTATVYANPVVNIGYDATSMADVVNPFITPQVVFDFDTAVAHVYGNVYGGGNLAQIDGNTIVNVFSGEVGVIGYTYKHDNNSHEVYDSIYHVEYDVANHLIGGSVYGSGKGSYSNMDDGRVKGNTSVNISGGHVYYSVYGGGEMASVGKHTNVLEDPDDLDSDIIDIAPVANTGLATVTITGGQVGPAPKTDEGYNIPIGLNGMDGYVFGGGKGDGSDEHDLYKDYTNVNAINVIVQIPSDADPLTNRIWGSVFGGSEDGHVLGDIEVSYRSGILGTSGTTSYDGNIFGSGRNYRYSSDVSGRVRGNVTIGMSGGLVKGNIYGGGRLGATGIDLNGNMIDDDSEHTYGHTIVTVSGGEVGTTVNSETSGNVYGGGMGRYLDDEGEQMWVWETFGKVKQTQVNISDAVVKGSVYGGGEIALVEKTTKVNITSGTIGGVSGSGSYYGSVFGGGKGFLGLSNPEANPKAGQVGVSTEVNMSGGQVYENVYGGGEIASVGNYTYDETYEVDETWHITAIHYDILNVTNGTTNVNITGGEVGPLDGTGMNGYVFGAGQGVSNDVTEYFKAFANVVDANVTISDNAQVDGSVLGGSAEGHVLEDVTINITGGTIGTDGYSLGDGNVLGGGGNQSLSNYSAGRVGGNIDINMSGGDVKGSVYGGGYAGLAGVDMNGNPYTTDIDDHGNVTVNISGGTIGNTTVIDDQFVGNVFGSGKGVETDSLFGLTLNTDVCISGTAQVLGDVYGGGEMASVGDFIYDNTVTDSITGVTAGTGTAKVAIRGGQVGVVREGQSLELKGRVFGGGLGKVTLTDDYLNIGNVGNTEVLVADTKVSEMETVSPYIVNSVFGGAMNGHVIKNTSVTVKGGTIGKPLTLAERKVDERGQGERIRTGNVYGGGSGATVLGYAPINTNPGAPEYPQYSQKAGRVYGNTEVTVKAGTVRHAVYGGGNMASVGIFSTDGDGIATYTAGGQTTVTIDSVALIGPKKADLAGDQITENYKCLGANEGWVFGSSRGISGGKLKHMSFVDTTIVNIGGNAQVVSCVFGGGENGHVQKGTNVNVTGGIIGGIPMHGTSCTATSGEYADVALTGLDDELALDEYGIGRRVFRGNVFGGGKGNDSIFWQTPFKYCYTAGRVYGNTHVTVSGGTIYNRVYGGGTIASVGTFEYDNPNNAQAITGVVEKTGRAYVTVSGGQIGTNGLNNGDVVGGGRGIAGRPKKAGETLTSITQPLTQAPDEAYVGSTYVTINGGTIANCVYGGSINGHVQEDSHVVIDQVNNAKPTIIGTLVSGNPVTVQGGWHSNVYGGGGGMTRYTDVKKLPGGGTETFTHLSVTSGRVFGDTYVEIKGGTIYNNVYGGGAIASVGTYDLDPEATSPYVGHGYTHVTVTGGTIGYNGEGNGHVFGAARGWPDAPLAYLDTLSYAAYTEVNIGTEGSSDNTTPLVLGSVFGSGENGHTYKKANVNIYSGTIEQSVYGGGEGEDPYYVTENEQQVAHYNPIAGVVAGNTEVKMKGGTVKENVYGGGRMASVGVFLQNYGGTPELIVLPDNGDDTYGHTKVEITGGSIGRIDGHENEPISVDYPRSGFVFGGSKGLLLNPVTYPKWTKLANVKITDVTVGGTALVKSSVYGGGEMGRVLDSTYVKIQGNAVIGEKNEDLAFHRGNVFGGGSGNDSITYAGAGTGTGTGYVFMREAGRVEGNARVEMSGGHVYNSVYGGCEVTSVGLFGIADAEHPEVPEGALYWVSNPDVTGGGGKATVNISGGNVGWKRTEEQIKNKPRYGYVYGSGKGAPRTYFNTWTNVKDTYVTISGTEAVHDTIYGCVFGSGEEAHVVGNTNILVQGDTTNTWIGTYGTTGADGNVFGSGRGKNPVALTAGGVGGNTRVDIKGGRMMGSIFGGGANASVGIYFTPQYNPDTNTEHSYYGVMQDGTNHGYTTVNISGGTIGHHSTDPEDRTGGNVYGGGKGTPGPPGSINQRMAKVKDTQVNISQTTATLLNGTHIMGSVFGSGEDGHVLQDAHVTITGGQIGGKKWVASGQTPAPCVDPYHGNVYGGGRGLDKYVVKDDEGHVVYENGVPKEAYSITAGKVDRDTYVTITGGRVVRNVYGGGNIASVGDFILVYNEETHQYDTTGLKPNTGKATVRILGGEIGIASNADHDHGNVFGSSHGVAGRQYKDLAFVHNTEVVVDSVAKIYGAVFGGGDDGHVNQNTLVNVSGGTIGFQGNDIYHGNVYGGGRGLDTDENGEYSPTAGEVYGKAVVNIKKNVAYNHTPTIWHNVYGGGSASVVHVSKTVNISDGEIKANVFGGSRHLPEERENKAPRCVNMWGGTVGTLNTNGNLVSGTGNVYGCSYQGTDGDPAHDKNWAAFLNLSGGTILGNVYGAGYQGNVIGSVGVLIGKNAIASAPTLVRTADSLKSVPATLTNALDIKGDVYAGSNFFDGTSPNPWRAFDVTGFSNVYIDGKDYKTDNDPENSDPEMYIRGGLFGSGTNCEAGAAGRNIVLRNYGKREMYDAPGGGGGGGKDVASDSLTSVTRTMRTIQRVGNLFMDGANIALTGQHDIKFAADDHNDPNYGRIFGVFTVDTSFVMCNGSSIVLGRDVAPAFIDSVKVMRSVQLSDVNNIYSNFFLCKIPYTWIGVLDPRGRYDDPPGFDVNLYYQGGTDPLDRKTQENVILFNGRSQLFVRYHIREANTYGELQGFFRMSSRFFKPHDSESFAYARQKVAPISGKDEPGHTADGGFVSYNSPYNFFTDGGDEYTKTNQYPYTNILMDPALGECRGWLIPEFNGNKWYVDGTGLRGGTNTETAFTGRGIYPDKPKLTIKGGDDPDHGVYSIMGDNSFGDPTKCFNSETDVIYVVGAVSGVKELLNNANHTLGPTAPEPTLPLRIYRYPGGHLLSDKVHYDGGPDYDEEDGDPAFAAGPGPYYGTLLDLNNEDSSSITMADTALILDMVLIDGLYGVTAPAEIGDHEINFHGSVVYHDTYAEAPLVTVNKGTLLMKGGTELRRGYNKTDASGNLAVSGPAYYNFYRNPDFDNRVINGGGLYVAATNDAIVKVEGLVTIEDNLQKNGASTILSNVYLPTFNKYIDISGALDVSTSIGVTSPIRNTDPDYHNNTLSPVAHAGTSAIAYDAWQQCNFTDDQGWFFAKDNKIGDPAGRRTTYLGTGSKDGDNKTLYFGWTWASVVRAAPEGFSNDNIDSPEDLAWLITAAHSATNLRQTADLDMGQYVWVPIGSKNAGETPFSGKFDGQGHLIKNLYIDYIGTGDLIYERTNYGLFGNVDGGTIDRTFVVSGLYQPYISELNGTTGKNIGGLVGFMEGTSTVSNSEAAVTLKDYNNDAAVTENVMGGLVGKMMAGEAHSSMAMSSLSVGPNYHGIVGGLVGSTMEGSTKGTLGKVYNSFAKGTFSLSADASVMAGGLVGDNNGALVRNCYVTWHSDVVNALTVGNFGKLAASNPTASNIQNCYAMKDTTFGDVISGSGSVDDNCHPYMPVYSADMLGYMYADNKIEGDTAMFVAMNRWVENANGTGHKYASWVRPGLQEINDDLPVLLLSEFDGTKDHQGGFRSLSTYNGGPALQYGGPVRDTIISSSPQLDGALTRATAGNSLFIYGDVVVAPTVAVSADKVSIYEHASILAPGTLVTAASGSKDAYDDTYVGITFDNSKKSAIATYGVNYGLSGGSSYLSRDWHMFSTPLASAPLGFDYKGHNEATYNGGANSNTGHYNNPWVDQSTEFSWLNGDTGGNNRYWMKGWTNSQGPNTPSDFNSGQWVDGYFPSNIASGFGETCIQGTDEYRRYPYGMDFYTWTEPDYHWINFKRNGPNHWHSDGNHEHINYKPYGVVTAQYPQNVNEENLIVGRGYMAAIATQTFLQSHGTLNTGAQTIELTYSGAHCKGWNLVGNPYHAYIDFDTLAKYNNKLLAKEGGNPFYVVYNADGYDGAPSDAFVYYVASGSKRGAYAGRYLHPHQGFYVKISDEACVPEADHVLDFADGTGAHPMVVSRQKAGDAPLRDERPEYPLVNLFLSSVNGCNDVTVIELERPEWGGAVKLRELRNGNGVFYAQHDNTHFAALFAKVGTERVPLWFEAKEDDIYTIKWNTANGTFQSMYLIDNILGVRYDMLRNDSYSFEGHVGDYPSRFYIVFNVTDVDENLEGNGFVFFDGSQWMVTGNGQLEFIDVQGQVLLRTQVNGGQTRVAVPDVAPGVYLFRLHNSEGTKVQKVIVKR